MKQRNNRTVMVVMVMVMITTRSMVNLQKLIVVQLVRLFTAVYATGRSKSANLWYVTPCSLVQLQRRLEGTCGVHLQGR
jgi:hypothetical protein